MKNFIGFLIVIIVCGFAYIYMTSEYNNTDPQKVWKKFSSTKPSDLKLLYVYENSKNHTYFIKTKLIEHFASYKPEKLYSLLQEFQKYSDEYKNTEALFTEILYQKQDLSIMDVDLWFSEFNQETKDKFLNKLKPVLLDKEKGSILPQETAYYYLHQIYDNGTPQEKRACAERLVYDNYDPRFNSLFFEIIKEFPEFKEELGKTFLSVPLDQEQWAFTFLLIPDKELATKVFCLRDISKFPYFELKYFTSFKETDHLGGWGDYSIEYLSDVVNLAKEELDKRTKNMLDPNELVIRQEEVVTFGEMFSDLYNDAEANQEKANKIWENFVDLLNPNILEICFLIHPNKDILSDAPNSETFYPSLDMLIDKGIDLTGNIEDYIQANEYYIPWVYDSYYAYPSRIMARILAKKDGLSAVQLESLIFSDLDEDKELRKEAIKKLRTAMINEGYLTPPNKKGDLREFLELILRRDASALETKWAAEQLSLLRLEDPKYSYKYPHTHFTQKQSNTNKLVQELQGNQNLANGKAILSVIDVPSLKYHDIYMVANFSHPEISAYFKKVMSERDKTSGFTTNNDLIKIFLEKPSDSFQE